MDLIKSIMPVLWQIIEKNKKCAINVSTYEDKLTISILFGKRKKRFIETDGRSLVTDLQHFLAA